MATIVEICKEVGVEFGGYYFSEAQDGKVTEKQKIGNVFSEFQGAADRQISHGKRKVKGHVNGGGDGSTASEIVFAMIQPTLLKVGITTIVLHQFSFRRHTPFTKSILLRQKTARAP